MRRDGEQRVEKPVKQHAAEIHEGRLQAACREFADFPAVRSHVAASEHERGAAFDDRLEQVRIVRDVVFEVCVLNEQDVSRRGGESLPDRMPLALRPGLDR